MRSYGFGGVGPATKTSMVRAGPDGTAVGTTTVWTAASSGTAEARKDVSPGAGLTPKFFAIVGLRRSVSIKRTRVPLSAATLARYHAVVVFPSPGAADVMR